jgi:hypothetical protein
MRRCTLGRCAGAPDPREETRHASARRRVCLFAAFPASCPRSSDALISVRDAISPLANSFRDQERDQGITPIGPSMGLSEQRGSSGCSLAVQLARLPRFHRPNPYPRPLPNDSTGICSAWFRQGVPSMRIGTVALALGGIVALCSPFTEIVHAKTQRVIIVTPPTPPPYWDSNLVPRYRYRAEDDRVDPCGGPVVPVIRYGPQEVAIPLWLASEWGYPVIHGRDWPCRGRR